MQAQLQKDPNFQRQQQEMLKVAMAMQAQLQKDLNFQRQQQEAFQQMQANLTPEQLAMMKASMTPDQRAAVGMQTAYAGATTTTTTTSTPEPTMSFKTTAVQEPTPMFNVDHNPFPSAPMFNPQPTNGAHPHDGPVKAGCS